MLRGVDPPQGLGENPAACGFRILGLWILGFGALGFRVLGFRVLGFGVLGLRILGFGVLGFRVHLGFSVQGLGFRICVNAPVLRRPDLPLRQSAWKFTRHLASQAGLHVHGGVANLLL